MKKLLSIFLSLLLTVMLTACGNSLPKWTSQEAYDIGLEAYETMDAFCNGSMNRETCEEKLSEYSEELDSINTVHEWAETSSDYMNDGSIALTVSSAIIGLSLMDDDETYKIEEAKNRLAELLELK